MSGTPKPGEPKRQPRKPGQLKDLNIPEAFFDPLPEEELWWWEFGDEPDPCGPSA